MIELVHRSEFEAILKNYHPHKNVEAVLSNTKIALLMGLSASGRNTLIQTLLKTGSYHFIISDTTRPPRNNGGILEQSGVEYWFKSEEEVLEGLKKGKYIEAAIIHNQQVSGVSVTEIERAREADQIAITDIQQEGIDAFCKLKDDTISIFMLPPSYELWIERLSKRGKLADGEFERRKESAISELEHLFSHPGYKIVVNDDFDSTLAATRRVIEQGKYTEQEHEDGLQVAKSIYESLKDKN